MKKLSSLLIVFILMLGTLFAQEAPKLTGDVIKDALINEYKNFNDKMPTDETSITDIINSSSLYSTMTGEDQSDPDKGMLNKLIKVFDAIYDNGSALVTLKLQGTFYPEGTLENEQEAQAQRQRFMDVLIPIIADTMLDEQEMLDSIYIYDSIPYFTIKLNQSNIWKLLDSKGIVDIELVELAKPELAQSNPLIGANTAWSNGADGSGIAVAVLDTGVRKSHTFLQGKVVSEACYSKAGGYGSGSTLCPGGGYAKTSTGSGVNCSTSFSACSHGTHVAGIIAGKSNGGLQGVAKEAKIIAIQVFTNINGQILSYGSDQIRGLQRVYALRNTYKIAAANMSLGGGKKTSYCNSDARKAIIDNLLSVGIATVISSGNNGYTNAVGAPGCIQTAVTVGASSDGGWGNGVDSVDSYSNSAYMVDLLAPGSAIYSSIATSNYKYSTYKGTSMAAPHVAGAFAVLKSVDNDITVNQALSILKSTGKNIKDSKNNITKPRINVSAAVTALGSADVTVTISPDGAATDGAQWRIDGGIWRNSGVTVSDVMVGQHTITFKGIDNSNNSKVWQTPSPVSINITESGENKNKSATYVESNKLTVKKDLSDDGRSDILLRNKNDGRYLLMTMNGSEATNIQVAQLNNAAYTQNYGIWVNKGLADFNGDDKIDILMRNKYNGKYTVALMNGGTVSSSSIVTLNGSQYKASFGVWLNKGLGDFNGDGKADILMRNKNDGRHMIMTMNGTVASAVGIATNNNKQYKPSPKVWLNKGLGDFNGDGKTDILMRNKNDGRYLMMMMNGTAATIKIVSRNGSQYKPPYSILVNKGLADFNGDGKTDILMRNKYSGKYIVMTMNSEAATVRGATFNGNFYKPKYTVWLNKGLADFNGDGNADILMRNKNDGRYLLMTMNGSTISAVGIAKYNNKDYKPNYKIWRKKGIGDYNGDGNADILMRNKNDGRYLLMNMDGSTATTIGIVSRTDSTQYKPNFKIWLDR